jgi:hypothetical protein
VGTGSRSGAPRPGGPGLGLGPEAHHRGYELEQGLYPERQSADPHRKKAQLVKVRYIEKGYALVVHLGGIFLVVGYLHGLEGADVIEITEAVVPLEYVMRHKLDLLLPEYSTFTRFFQEPRRERSGIKHAPPP